MVPRCIDGTAFCEVRGRKLGEGGEDGGRERVKRGKRRAGGEKGRERLGNCIQKLFPSREVSTLLQGQLL